MVRRVCTGLVGEHFTPGSSPGQALTPAFSRHGASATRQGRGWVLAGGLVLRQAQGERMRAGRPRSSVAQIHILVCFRLTR